MASRIDDYGLIGNCASAALVSHDGSIDWLCWPRFDSGAVFAALLGREEHGCWKIAPLDPKPRRSRRYLRDTLILETEFTTSGGTATLTDFMLPQDLTPRLARLVRGKRGQVRFRTELTMRFDYGAIVPFVTRMRDDKSAPFVLRAIAGPDMLILRGEAGLHGRDMKTVGEFTVSEGECVAFTLSYAPSHLAPPDAFDPRKALTETEAFWRGWVGRCRYFGEWREATVRSLLILKALIYNPTGGIIAAPTTSLPERIGGPRNWDYRYCWLRDATFTLMALMHNGYYEEAQAWREWLQRAVAGSPSQIQIMYGLAGERRLTEWEIGWLPGYEGSMPVRIGNAASTQLQLDIFGEVMDTLHQGRIGGLAASESGWALQRAFIAHLEKIWTRPDEGIWEVRGGKQHFTYSKVMAWVAFDRIVKSATKFGLDGPVERWRRCARQIHEEVCSKGFDKEMGSFIQSYGSKELDASLLLIPLVGFLPATDPRVRGTIEAIERELTVEGLVRRYNTATTSDGLPPGEGLFLSCSFWLADCLALLGRHEEALRLFERLLGLRNDLGLLAEEYDPRSRRLLGNFPQALSHLALIGTANNLSAAGGPARHRPEGGS